MSEPRKSNVETVISWPRPATPCDLVPKWAGEFRSHADWVSFAKNRLTRTTGTVGEQVNAICVDALGRRCHNGRDMKAAADEGAFPVRYFWECEPSAATVNLDALRLARNRLQRLALDGPTDDFAHGNITQAEVSDWAREAAAAVAQLEKRA